MTSSLPFFTLSPYQLPLYVLIPLCLCTAALCAETILVPRSYKVRAFLSKAAVLLAILILIGGALLSIV